MGDCSYEDVISNIKSIISDKGMKQKAVAERAGFRGGEVYETKILNNEQRGQAGREFVKSIRQRTFPSTFIYVNGNVV